LKQLGHVGLIKVDFGWSIGSLPSSLLEQLDCVNFIKVEFGCLIESLPSSFI